MTEDEILYTLITSMNLDFVVGVKNTMYTKFSAPNLTIQQNHDGNIIDDRKFVVTNAVDSKIYLDTLDIDMIWHFYDNGMKRLIKDKEFELEEIKRIRNEQKHSRIPKDISHLLGIPYDDLKVVGGGELIYVGDSYNNSERNINDLVDRNLLDRYMKEHNIRTDVRILTLTPDEYKSRYPISYDF